MLPSRGMAQSQQKGQKGKGRGGKKADASLALRSFLDKSSVVEPMVLCYIENTFRRNSYTHTQIERERKEKSEWKLVTTMSIH